MKNKPENVVIIIGAMKSGTTSLYKLLSQHPSICPCSQKEPNYFSSKNLDLSQTNSYLDLWPEYNSKVHTWALEASTNYSKRPAFQNVPERIAQVKNLNFKFIYCVRDPVSRIKSHMAHMAISRKNINHLKLCDHFINVSRYYFQIHPYLDLFSKENILIVPIGRLNRHPSDVLNEVCEFLCIDTSFEFPVEQIRANSAAWAIKNSFLSLMKSKELNWNSLIFTKFAVLSLFSIYTQKIFKGSYMNTFFQKLDPARISRVKMKEINLAISDDLEFFLKTFKVDKNDLH
jgi:hypothetical protein